MTKQKRDNEYYLQRLKKERPALFADVQAGRISVAQARQLAGLGGHRTRLHELKNAWDKASPGQRTEFLSWAGLRTLPVAVPPAGSSAFGADGIMLDWARRRIPEVMQRRHLSAGDLAAELGLKRLDASVMLAVRGNVRVKTTTAAEVARWLASNASV